MHILLYFKSGESQNVIEVKYLSSLFSYILNIIGMICNRFL